MPEVSVRRPLHELKLPHKDRLQPATSLHLLSRQALAPSAAPRLWQVHERTLWYFKRVEAPIQLCSGSWRKSVASPGSIKEVVPFIVPEDQRIEVPRAGSVPSDHKLLPLIDSHFAPGPGALAGFVPAVEAFGHNALKSVSFHTPHQIRKAGIQLGGLADGFTEVRQDVAAQYITTYRKLLWHDVLPSEDHNVENEINHHRPP